MKNKFFLPILVIIASVFAASTMLIWLDYETKSWADVFGWNLLNAFLFYGLPASIISILIYLRISKVINRGASVAISVIAATPATFISMIFLLYILRALNIM